MNVVYRGAEATLYRDKYLGIPVIKKERKPKKYRIREIDDIIRKERIKKEVKMLKKAREVVKTPHTLQVNLKDHSIVMEELEGSTIKKRIEENQENPQKLGREIGKMIRGLHDKNIAHNDLTTSNMIRKGGEIFLIDFGMAEDTHRIENKAMDLLVFKKMLKSTHWKVDREIWENMKKGYRDEKTIKKLKEIEERARYL